MTLDRRGFFATGAVAAASLAVANTPFATTFARAEGEKKQAALKLSSQLGLIPGKSLEEKLEKMKKWGFEAFEPHGDAVDNVEKYKDAAKNSGLKISAICWGSINGDIVSDVVEKRAPAIEKLKKALAAAGELECNGVIYVPAFNGQTKLTNQEIRKLLEETLPALGEYAVSVKSRILLEPLNRKEAFFLRQLADAASICRDCNSPGVCQMGDFYHMCIEETSDLGAFISAGPYLHHVHLASRIRVLPGQDDRQFVDGFKGLKWIGYQDYCSFECGVKGDREVEIPKSMAFLREQWDKAVL